MRASTSLPLLVVVVVAAPPTDHWMNLPPDHQLIGAAWNLDLMKGVCISATSPLTLKAGVPLLLGRAPNVVVGATATAALQRRGMRVRLVDEVDDNGDRVKAAAGECERGSIHECRPGAQLTATKRAHVLLICLESLGQSNENVVWAWLHGATDVACIDKSSTNPPTVCDAHGQIVWPTGAPTVTPPTQKTPQPTTQTTAKTTKTASKATPPSKTKPASKPTPAPSGKDGKGGKDGKNGKGGVLGGTSAEDGGGPSGGVVAAIVVIAVLVVIVAVVVVVAVVCRRRRRAASRASSAYTERTVGASRESTTKTPSTSNVDCTTCDQRAYAVAQAKATK